MPRSFVFAALLLFMAGCSRDSGDRGEAPLPSGRAEPAAARLLEAPPVVAAVMRTLERTDGDCAAPAGCARVRLEIAEIQQAPTPAARDALNRFIRDSWLGPSFSAPPGTDLAALAESLFRSRREILAENPGVPAGWWAHRTIDVLYQDERAVSLRYGGDSYTGGERPIQEVLLASFDPRTGRRLTLAGILTPGSEEPLRALALERFRQLRLPVPAGPPFEGHFAVVEAGLLFHFDEGSQIVLTRAELAALVRPDGPLAGPARPRIPSFPAPGEAPLEAQEPESWSSTDVPR